MKTLQYGQFLGINKKEMWTIVDVFCGMYPMHVSSALISDTSYYSLWTRILPRVLHDIEVIIMLN